MYESSPTNLDLAVEISEFVDDEKRFGSDLLRIRFSLRDIIDNFKQGQKTRRILK